MHAVRIVIISEFVQLSREVDRVPEEHAIEIFAANGAEQPFDEQVRNRDGRDGLDLLDLEYTRVGEPTVKAKQRVVIGTDVFRQRLAGDGVIEHSANRAPVNIGAFDTETDVPAREHVHDYQHRVTAQKDRFATASALMKPDPLMLAGIDPASAQW